MELLVAISQIAGSLALVITVVILLRELRENNRLARAANTQALVQISSPFHLALIADRSFAEIHMRGGKGLTDPVDKHRHRMMVIYWLIFHENVYFQWRQDLLDHRIYTPWERDLRTFIEEQDVAALWPKISELFQQDFADYVTTFLTTSVSGTTLVKSA